MTSGIDSCCVALEIRRVVKYERRSPQQPPQAIKCYAIIKAIDFDTGFASFVLGDNPILSLMTPISSLPPLMVCGVGGRLVASSSLCVYSACVPVGKGQPHIVHVKLEQGGSAAPLLARDTKTKVGGFTYVNEVVKISEYLEYKAAKERRLWDDVQSRRSPTKYNEADVDSFHRNKIQDSIWEHDDAFRIGSGKMVKKTDLLICGILRLKHAKLIKEKTLAYRDDHVKSDSLIPFDDDGMIARGSKLGAWL
ncbi:hypothetical protein Tco_0828879 [Tanacetum coccineum]